MFTFTRTFWYILSNFFLLVCDHKTVDYLKVDMLFANSKKNWFVKKMTPFNVLRHLKIRIKLMFFTFKG